MSRLWSYLLLLLASNVCGSIKAAPDMKLLIHAVRNQQQVTDLNKATDLNNEGLQLSRQGEYEEAHQKLTESLEIKERLHGHDTIMVALSLMNLGDNYLAWGKYDEAEKASGEALRIRRKAKDPDAKYSEELLDDIDEARLKAAQEHGAPPECCAAPKPAAFAYASIARQRNSSKRNMEY